MNIIYDMSWFWLFLYEYHTWSSLSFLKIVWQQTQIKRNVHIIQINMSQNAACGILRISRDCLRYQHCTWVDCILCLGCCYTLKDMYWNIFPSCQLYSTKCILRGSSKASGKVQRQDCPSKLPTTNVIKL